MLFRLAGSDNFVILQPSKALLPMFVTCGMSADVRFLQPQKAILPMVVTCGMSADVRLVQL